MTGPLIISWADMWLILTGSGIANAQATLVVEIIRLPRIILSLLVGGILATCGALLQGLFRNPLADPALIGVSAGASVGASLIIVFGSLWFTNGVLLGLSAISMGAFFRRSYHFSNYISSSNRPAGNLGSNDATRWYSH